MEPIIYMYQALRNRRKCNGGLARLKVWKHDRIEIIPNDQGNRITPSCVAFTHTDRLIGDGAKNQISRNPSNTVFDSKRMIGRRFSDDKLLDDMKLWPFKVVEGPNDAPRVVVTYKGQEKQFSAEEISSMVLTWN
nr:heat shock cognate 70 kDa protein-like [Tanacetum cinerariifolium]